MGTCDVCKKPEEMKTSNDLFLKKQFHIHSKSNDETCSDPRHNFALVSKICSNKLISDKGNVMKYKTETIKNAQIILQSLEQTPKNESCKIEEDKKSVKSQDMDSLIPSLAFDLRRAVTAINQPKIKLLGGFKIDIKTKRVPLISFDPSNLILENKGKVTDNYKIVKLLGKGTFGEVHKIMHMSSKLYYAMKSINKTNYDEVENIINEIEILKSLVILLIKIGSSKYSATP